MWVARLQEKVDARWRSVLCHFAQATENDGLGYRAVSVGACRGKPLRRSPVCLGFARPVRDAEAVEDDGARDAASPHGIRRRGGGRRAPLCAGHRKRWPGVPGSLGRACRGKPLRRSPVCLGFARPVRDAEAVEDDGARDAASPHGIRRRGAAGGRHFAQATENDGLRHWGRGGADDRSVSSAACAAHRQRRRAPRQARSGPGDYRLAGRSRVARS